LRRRAIYLSAALVLALGMAGTALWLGDLAQRAAVTSENARRVAFARELAGAAVNNLSADPERSLLLALQAISTTRAVDGTVLPSAEEALHAALIGSHVRLTLSGHAEWVMTGAYSPDGTRLASVERDGTVIVWAAATGQALWRLPGSTPLVDDNGYQRLAFSPVTDEFAAADAQVINIWNAQTGERRLTLKGHTADVWAVAYSPDGRWLATGGVDGTVRLWDVATGALLHTLTGHTASVEGVAFSPDGKLLVSVGDDRALRVWDAATGDLVRADTDFPSLLYSVAFSPMCGSATTATTPGCGAQVWFGSDEGLHTLAVGTPGSQLALAGGYGGPAFSRDGRWMAVLSNSQVTVWDTASQQVALTLLGHTNWATSVSFSPDGHRLATTSYDRTVKVWDLQAEEMGPVIAAADEQVAYAPDSRRLVTAGSSGTATIWDAANGTPQLTLPSAAPVLGLAYSPDGQRVILGQIDNVARVWDTVTGALVFTLAGHTVGVRDVAYSPDGRQLLTASFDGTAKLWDAATGAEVRALTGHQGILIAGAFSPDSQAVATGSSDKTAILWDAATGAVRLTLTGHTEPVEDLAFSPNGGRLVTGSGDGTAMVWDTATGAALLTLRGHTSDVRAVTFSPDGALIATGGGDSLVIVWDAATGAELHRLPGAPGGVTSVAFDPAAGGTRLAVAGPGGQLRLFALDIDELLPLAYSRATRPLTLDECRRYLHLEACP
jgi:eukaryotic-like serine/threonine-protein kinase